MLRDYLELYKLKQIGLRSGPLGVYSVPSETNFGIQMENSA